MTVDADGWARRETSPSGEKITPCEPADATASAGSHGVVLLVLVGEVHQGVSGAEVRAAPEVADGDDVEGFLEKFGVAVANAGEGGYRGGDEFCEGLVLIRLVDQLGEVCGDWNWFLLNG
jgi:hypothetical protein